MLKREVDVTIAARCKESDSTVLDLGIQNLLAGNATKRQDGQGFDAKPSIIKRQQGDLGIQKKNSLVR